MKYLWTIVFLGGCVSASQVIPSGNGSYVVIGHASGGLNAGKGHSAALLAASNYCADRHETMSLVSMDTQGLASVGGESVAVSFRCQ